MEKYKIIENFLPSPELIKIQKAGYKIIEVPIKILYEGETSTHNPISHGSSVIISTLKFVAIERPLSFYGIPGMILFCVGLSFGIWEIQIFLEQNVVVSNIALVAGIGIILGVVLLITATILHSIVSIVREK